MYSVYMKNFFEHCKTIDGKEVGPYGTPILYLDEFKYEESLVDTIFPNWRKENLATHTFNQANSWQFIDSQQFVRKI